MDKEVAKQGVPIELTEEIYNGFVGGTCDMCNKECTDDRPTGWMVLVGPNLWFCPECIKKYKIPRTCNYTESTDTAGRNVPDGGRKKRKTKRIRKKRKTKRIRKKHKTKKRRKRKINKRKTNKRKK